jgi:sigma54-dependent transcription regulator
VSDPRPLAPWELAKLRGEWQERKPSHTGRRLLATLADALERIDRLEQTLQGTAECSHCRDCAKAAHYAITGRP